MANNVTLEAIYNLINSKKIEEMNIVLNWFEKGEYKNDKETKKQLKEEINKKPITFKPEQTKQKEIFETLIKSIS